MTCSPASASANAQAAPTTPPPPALFSKKGAYARLMDWSMKDPVFKTQLFRFVDVLPSLNSSAEIVRHLQEYLGDKAVELNPALKAGLAASNGEARRHVQGGAVKINDAGVSDERMSVGTAEVTADGVIKLSLGKKKHILIKPV